MLCSNLFVLLSSILLCPNLCTAQPTTFRYRFCLGGNYTRNSTYQANLNLLLTSISSNVSVDNRFNTATAGQNPDRVNGLFLCKGDVTPEQCRNCITVATGDVPQRCPTSKEAILWYDDCMLRYSNRSIFSTMEETPTTYLWNVNNVTNPDEFSRILGGLINGIVRQAAFGSSTAMFATGEAKFIVFQSIYGLAQCTPDISENDCNRCLEGAVGYIPICCDGKQGGRVLRPSCNIRFEIYPFYQLNITASPPPPPPSLPLTPSAPTNTTTTEGKGGRIVFYVMPSITAVIILIFICFCLLKRKQKKKVEEDGNQIRSAEDVDQISSVESLQFNFEKLRAATNNFSESNKLGQGGFGSVYKGKLLDGQDVAVKRLCRNSGQGELEFKNEVLLLAKLQHRNLVRLLGFCIEGEEKLLIYEFVPNTSLNHFLFDPIKRAELDWGTRYKIIEGIARGLLYLHEDSRLRIIHRDLKASNILLDRVMNPKISDFGMARLFVQDQTHANTNRIVGTFGYMAPEYAMRGQFSVKSDVFSFGILLLEIVSGKKNTEFCQQDGTGDLVRYAWRHWTEGTAINLVDPALGDGYSREEVLRCIQIGLLCVQEHVTNRPTMASVVLMLSSSSATLNPLSSPTFSVPSRMKPYNYRPPRGYDSSTSESRQSTSESKPLSVNEASITELSPR
ncbi:PREDICTED: putative receptor-like protein kinase At4g00960 [Nelumbo nucifera]|uniref:Receptor-like protein kinase At4g00960 n=2 Tax=Nelumbo nucifera TaxID=4432 RepID=A0A1U7Z376_NELNU|nr:PREDICTED: putative receptor-like protein kinase At4g00960 [Nelumbo nucifera]XP_010247619.1 PREDICTED: putative receptor-like protein kinase At4g00960 [Nelumbo nucifera]DAD20628.1 TPA_asm: hypothetical protein HUJ06_022091 [Nelumbo nucifera]